MKKLNELETKLRTVGKSSFVYLLEFIKKGKGIEEAKKELGYDWAESSYNAKFSATKAIIAMNQEADALNIIINSKKVDEAAKMKAQQMLNSFVEDEIEVVERIRVKDDKLLNELVGYALGQGVEIQGIIDNLLDYINNNIGDDIHLSINGNDEEVFVMSTPQEIEVIECDEKLIEVEKHRMEDVNLKKRFSIKSKDINTKFKSRLGTQNRKYSNGFTYFPAIFKKLDIDFNSVINGQVDKVYTYIKKNETYDRIRVNTLSKIIYNEGKLYGENGKEKYELYFLVNNVYHSFEGYIDEFKEVSLGHTKSMYNIIDGLKSDLKQLRGMSNLIGGCTVTDIKSKVISDRLAKKVNELVDVEELKREILMIEDGVEMELIPLRVNIAMGKN